MQKKLSSHRLTDILNRAGEELCSLEGHARGRPFLSTIDISCCFVVFAWQPPAADGLCGKGYGVHIDHTCVLYSSGVYGKEPRPGLRQLTDSLRRHFTDGGPVRVTVLGGMEGGQMDLMDDLATCFREDTDLRKCSNHVRFAVVNAGLPGCKLKETDVSRMFPGRLFGKKYGTVHESEARENEARRDGAVFRFASLCLQSGTVFTHTRPTMRGVPVEATAVFDQSPQYNRLQASYAHNFEIVGPLIDAGRRCANIKCDGRLKKRDAETSPVLTEDELSRLLPPLRCSRCKAVWYCTETCQEEHKAEHIKCC